MVIGQHMRMQDGDITKADEPFGFCNKGGEIDMINDTTEAVAASTEEDGVHLWIGEEALQVGYAFPIGAGEVVMGHAAKRSTDLYPVTPLLQGIDAGLRLFERHIAGGANDADGVSGAKEWRKLGQDKLG